VSRRRGSPGGHAPTPGAIATLAVVVALLGQGCCCCMANPFELRDTWGSVLVVAADAFVPLALALALYSRQERKHRGAWATVAKRDVPQGAYRSMEVTLESAGMPRAVRVSGCLGFLDGPASLPALGLAASVLQHGWEQQTRSLSALALAAAPVILVLAIDGVAALTGQAVLARRASATWTRRIGAMLVVLGAGVLAILIVKGSALLAALATLLQQPEAPAVLGPSTATLLSAIAVVGWPVLVMSSGVALALAARELESPAPEP